MTEAMPFLQKYDITFLRPPTIAADVLFPEKTEAPYQNKELPFCCWFMLL